MAAFVLQNNYSIEFGGEVKHQTSGTAIGIKFVPTYDSIFMDKWFQYTDDVFWTHDKGKLEESLKDFNNYQSNIKFTHEFNKESIPFLNLKVSFSGGQLTTDLHIKSTDKHQCLHYTSSHPDHTKSSIVFRHALRVSRICSNKTDFERHLDDLKSWFQARGYPKHLVQKEMNKVRFNRQKWQY